MADFKVRNEFRKGMRMSPAHEDPTYLSFVLLFHFDDASELAPSPLFNGRANHYLTKVVRTDVGTTYANNLTNFKRVLRKVNTDMPWFWQSLKGLEKAMAYGEGEGFMKEPWWGAERPQLEIGCLEENVELTAIGLMDLYKRSTFDFTRWVEVVPKNLREFSMDVIVSEVRVFQKDSSDKFLGTKDVKESFFNNGGGQYKGPVIPLNQGYTELGYDNPTGVETKPFIRLRFTHCEFDINSIAEFFGEMSKNPEKKAPTIKINWGTVKQVDQKLGNTLFNEVKENPSTSRLSDVNPAANPAQQTATVNEDSKENPTNTERYLNILKDRTLGKVEDRVEGIVDNIGNQIDNLKEGFKLGPNGLDNVYGDGLGGAAGALLNKLEESVTAKLLLGNVHGAQGFGGIMDALNAGTIQSIGNLIGQMAGGSGQSGAAGGGDLGAVYPEIILDSSPDGNIQEKIHPKGIDSSPDGPINENVHE